MTLPRWLVAAIARDVDGGEMFRVAARWSDQLPEMRAAADRIRAQVASVRCGCPLPPDDVVNGRCGRCAGLLGPDPFDDHNAAEGPQEDTTP